MAITDWPVEQRPRERLIKLGPQSLSDTELLAIFLRVGVAGKSAVDLAQDMVDRFGSLNALCSAPLEELSSISGLGSAKYAQLQATLELSRRALAEKLQKGNMLNSPLAVRHYLQILFQGKPYEAFVVLFLDVKNRMICSEQMFRGTLTHTSVYPREVVKAALGNNAASVILAHNHPSGEPKPSAADHLLTKGLRQALQLIDVRVLDHIIIAGSCSYSFAEHGEL